jgi:hypothetical protein
VITLIGCSIFQEEVENILAGEGRQVEIEWLEVGLHDNLERLESVLKQTFEEKQRQGVKPEGLLFGFGCLPEMKAFAAVRGVRLLSVKNCLAILVGDDELRVLERNRTLVATPGWVRKMWLGRVGTVTGWKRDDYRLNFGRYDQILVLDPGLRPLTDEEIITCYDLVEVPLEIRPCGLEHFRQVLAEFLLVETVRKNC